jgi:peptide/nickel transport system ATP-binding protein
VTTEMAGYQVGVPAGAASAERLLTVDDLSVDFNTDDGVVHAVRHVSFDLDRREVLGVVGESGSGKSVSSMAIMGLLPRTAKVTGSINFNGRELVGLSYNAMRSVRGNGIAMIFQDPMTSLNPVFTVGWQLAEAYRAHHDVSKKAARAKAVETLDLVGIPQPDRRAQQFPHEFSGGMRQRAMIAMSIINDPDLIIADEPTTALDVTVQAQILETLLRIRDETSAAIIVITHDLGVIAGMVDRVQVMYGGTVVEAAEVGELFDAPRMPYTIGLIGSIPHVGLVGKRLTPIKGAPPSLMNLPSGCSFSPRCPLVIDICRQGEPGLMDTDRVDHVSRCHRWKVVAEHENPQKLFAHEEIGTIEDALVLQLAQPDEVAYGNIQDATAVDDATGPDADQPGVDQPSVDQPSVDQPSVDQPSVDQPGVDQPSVDQPSVDQPGVDQPSVEGKSNR